MLQRQQARWGGKTDICATRNRNLHPRPESYHNVYQNRESTVLARMRSPNPCYSHYPLLLGRSCAFRFCACGQIHAQAGRRRVVELQ